jgi:hypothetical protein
VWNWREAIESRKAPFQSDYDFKKLEAAEKKDKLEKHK